MKQTKEEYTKVLDDHNIERPKCKCCGCDIYYDNSTANYRGGRMIVKGKSYKTTKSVNGVDYQLKVCQKCLLEKYPDIKNLSRTFNVMSEQTKFAFDIPQDVFEQSREKYAMTKEHMISKYGEEDGTKKWDEYCKKQAETNTFEYKNKKYGMTREEFTEYNKSRAVTLDNLIKRHGKRKGTEIWKNYCEKQKETKTTEYMIATKPREEVIRILNGRMKGIRKSTYNNYSEISQKIFNEIDKELAYRNKNYHTYYHDKNFEYNVHHNYQTYMLDYYIEELRLCIEFNGDYWHANKNKYPADYVFKVGKNEYTAQDVWNKDIERENVMKKLNIKTIIIWESDVPKLDIKKLVDDIISFDN